MPDVLTIVASVATIVGGAYAIYEWAEKRRERRSLRVGQVALSNDTGIARKYAEYLLRAFSTMDFQGIVRLEKLAISFALEDVFVMPSVVPVSSLSDAVGEASIVEVPPSPVEVSPLQPHDLADPTQSLGVDSRIVLAAAANTKNSPAEGEEYWLAGRVVDARDLSALLGWRMARPTESLEPLSLIQMVERNQTVVVLGDPGSGKSTCLRAMALRYARALVVDSLAPVPILVPLSAYANRLRDRNRGALPLAAFLGEYYQHVRGVSLELEEYFRAALAEGRAVVLLDGLDEVGGEDERRMIAARVKDFIDWNAAAGNKVVVTSRIVGYGDAPLAVGDVAHFLILDFGEGEMEEFAQKWMAALEQAVHGGGDEAESSSAEKTKGLLRNIRASKGVRHLASNPLLLSVLVLIFRQGLDLPKRRAELYELYVKIMVGSWARTRNLEGTPIGPVDEAEAIKVLAPLAFWMHETAATGFATRDAIRAQVASDLVVRGACVEEESLDQARDVVDSLLSTSGLLTERGEGKYGFTHFTFEEYLAARHVVMQGQLNKSASVQMMLPIVQDPHWREVIKLAIGYVGIVAKEETAAAFMVEQLAGGAGEPESLERLIVAAECAADAGVAALGRETWEGLRVRLAEACEDCGCPRAHRLRAGEILGIMGDPRMDAFTVDPEMRLVGGGETIVGAADSEIQSMLSKVEAVALSADDEWVRDYWRVCLESESPTHAVSVPPFWMSRFPVTNSQYQEFINATLWPVPTAETSRAAVYAWDQETRSYPRDMGNLPVVLVTWEDAREYCHWLSERNKCVVRLPSEAQWEAASRGNDGRTFPWGDANDPGLVNTLEGGYGALAPTGVFPASDSVWQIGDTLGQVWEWTNTAWGHDWRDPAYGYPYADDLRETDTTSAWRVVRGGSWDDVLMFARCSARGPNLGTFKSHYIGFRIVSDVDLGCVSQSPG